MNINYVNIIGILAGVCTTVAVLPQIYKAIKTNNADDISPVFFSILVCGVALWTIYGVLKDDYPIIITNGISVILNSIMLFIYFKSEKKN
mgnify:CR=1 FL=1